jgi:hypothetical protein
VVNQHVVGRVSPDFEMLVERGKIREFARATGSANSAYFTSEVPPIPPTFLATQIYWFDETGDPWLLSELDVKRALHAEQEFTFFGPPPHAGDVLSFHTTVESVYEKSGRSGGNLRFAVMLTEFRDATGRVVAESRLTGVETTRAGDAS